MARNAAATFCRVLLIASLLLQTMAGLTMPASVHAYPLQDSIADVAALESQTKDIEPELALPAIIDARPDETADIREALQEETAGTPVYLSLDANKEFLRDNEEAQLTITLWRSNTDDGVEGIPVTLTLPPQLQLVDERAQTEWQLPNLALGENFIRTVTVALADDFVDEAAVVEIALSVGTEDEKRQSLQMGLLAAAQPLPPSDELPCDEPPCIDPPGDDPPGDDPPGDEPDPVMEQAIQGEQGTILQADGGQMMLLVPSDAAAAVGL